MSQKLWRVVRACVDMGPENPIEQIHDQGAGGNCNVVCLLRCWEGPNLSDRMQGIDKPSCLTLHKQLVLFVQVKEIIYPLGAEIDVREIKLGDETMSVLEIWGAEYQENDALLIKPEARPVLESICERERCLLQACSCSCLPALQPSTLLLRVEESRLCWPDHQIDYTCGLPQVHSTPDTSRISSGDRQHQRKRENHVEGPQCAT